MFLDLSRRCINHICKHKSQQITEFSIIALNICSHFVEGRDAIKTVVLTSTLG